MKQLTSVFVKNVRGGPQRNEVSAPQPLITTQGEVL